MRVAPRRPWLEEELLLPIARRPEFSVAYAASEAHR
jgi:hypothetical protein